MFVAFLDMLGFADAVDKLSAQESTDLEEMTLRAFGREVPHSLEIYRRYSFFQTTFSKHYEQLVLLAASKKRLLTGIAFTDSTFLASDDIWLIQHFCCSFMSDMYYQRIPVRGGIGNGSFFTLPMSTRNYPDKNLQVVCPFLGSAVVRAYRAEKCGLKGMRIFIHPSAVNEIRAFSEALVVPFHDHESTPLASAELNLLLPAMGPEYIVNEHRKRSQFVNDLAQSSEKQFREYYHKTLEALTRMRDHLVIINPEESAKQQAHNSGNNDVG